MLLTLLIIVAEACLQLPVFAELSGMNFPASKIITQF